MSNKQPRGIRNRNPGNLEWGSPWQGLLPVNQRTDPRFCQFQTPAWGIRALARTLITYQDKHNIKTVTAAINRWAPPVENDTSAYVRAVQKAVGGEQVDMHDYKYLRPMVEAIIRHENGIGPEKTANTWYDSATIDEGLHMAGVRKPTKEAGPVPVTKETIGATATGGVGVTQIAEGLPQVADAITQADSHLSSGSVVRVIVGLVLVGIAVFIAYSQIDRHKQGQL